jgi:TP901 family phage tail tape measure protein
MTQFDATARINVDLSGFARAAASSTSAGGAFTTSIRSLQTALTQVEGVNKRTTSQLMNALNLYKQLASTVNTYASAVKTLADGNNRASVNQRRINSALDALSGSLARVTGLTKEETAAKQRELRLYQQLAGALNSYASALQKMAAVQQKNTQLTNQQAQAQQRAEQAAQRLAQQEQRLAIAQQNLQLQSQRLAQQQQAMANSMNRTAGAANAGDRAFTNFSHSTFALRSSVGELEQGFSRIFVVLGAIPVAAAAAAISQEQAFAQVARVVGEAEAASAGLLDRFREIAQTAPISFEEVAKIGQLGAQIGISANELGDFTDTIVRFSITTGVAAEESTLLLGRIAEMQNVPIGEMENLGSAILALGTASAATDQEILRVNESIATASNIFGLTTQATSGLAAALATLRVRPELARGSLTRVFGQLRDAVEQGGDSLVRLSDIMGLTQKATVELFQTDTDQFFVKFVEGLSKAAENGESFRNVLSDLGVNAVRDIDTFSRLGNNFDVLADSVDRANIEYAKGSELQKQSKTIYETTANEIQNLSDAFKTFLAIVGAPLAKAINTIAKALTGAVETVAKLGPIVPILGFVATAVAVGATAWLALQIAMAKTLQGIIAMRELQNTLGVRTINLTTVIRAWRGELLGASQATAATTTAMRGQTVTAGQLATAMGAVGTASSRAVVANAALSTSLVSSNAGFKANTLAAGTATNSSTAFTTATARAAVANQAFAVSSAQAATSTRAVSAALVLTGSSANTAAAGVTAAAAATTRASAATTRASAATRAMTFAMGPWGIAIGTAALLLGGLVGGMDLFTSSGDKLYQSALEQTGGLDTLRNAIKADTDAAREGGKVYREVAVTKDKVSEADRRSAEAARDSAKARIAEIELIAGSVAELRRQGKAAQQYLNIIEDETGKIAEANAVLEDNVAIIGEQTRAWLLNTVQAAANESGIASNNKALKELNKTGVDVGDILTKSLSDPKKPTEDLEAAIKQLKGVMEEEIQGGIMVNSGPQLNETGKAAKKAKDFLEAMKKAIEENSDEAAANVVIQDLLGQALDDTGNTAVTAGGKVKLTTDNLEDLNLTTDEAQTQLNELIKTLGGFGTAFDAFKTAAEAAAGTTKSSTEEATAAVENFSLKTKTGFDAYLKELEKIATAQRNWATNLIKISATLGPGIAAELQKLGPEAAPFIQELADLSADKLTKLKPRLEAIMGDNVAGIATSIIKGQAAIENASSGTATLIANTLANELGAAKNTEKFNAVIEKYGTLLENLKNHKGEVNIDNVKGLKSIDDIINYIELSEDKRLFDPDGRAELKTELFKRGALDLLSLIIQMEKAGAFDPDGKAKMDPSSFTKTLGSIQDGVYRAERNGSLNPDGKAGLTNGNFYVKLAQFKRDSNSAGQTIQANLTRSATVSVGYYYYQKNTPPKTAQVKDGGWISGPGGPRDDRVPAMLSNGEFVVNARSAEANASLLEAINNGGRSVVSTEVDGLAAKMAAISSGGRSSGSMARVPESAAALSTGLARPTAQTVINVTNYYPQAEPTSKTVNRTLAFASALDGTT